MVIENWTPCRLPGVYRKSGQFALKETLSRNLICRDVVTVEVILPAVSQTLLLSPVKTIRPEGAAKFGWFGRLKTSARNCRARVSPSANDLPIRPPHPGQPPA
jgi:hypothetical protein